MRNNIVLGLAAVVVAGVLWLSGGRAVAAGTATGCNNVSPTVTEAAAAYAARVNPSSALIAIWEHQAATNTFRGYSPASGAPNDLRVVTRLKPVFVCVTGPSVLKQPPA
jgi:hypothetical protein